MSDFVWKPLDPDDVDVHEDPNSVVTTHLGVKKTLLFDDKSQEDVVLTSGHIYDKAKEVIELIRPYVKKDGGDVTLVGIRKGWVQIKFEGNCNDCGAFSGTLLEIEEAICEEVPDANGVEVIQD